MLAKAHFKRFLSFQFGQLQGFLVHQIGLGQDDETDSRPEKAKHLQVLDGLGHDPVIGRHHQHRSIHGAQASNRVLEEVDMPGDVHERNAAPVRRVHGGDPGIDGKAPPLFLLQSIRVHAGQGFDQARFSVVDVSGDPDGDMFGHLYRF